MKRIGCGLVHQEELPYETQEAIIAQRGSFFLILGLDKHQEIARTNSMRKISMSAIFALISTLPVLCPSYGGEATDDHATRP